MRRHSLASLVGPTMLLTACGGSDGGIKSVAELPAPASQIAPPVVSAQAARTPLPPTPATTSGTYHAISTYTSTDSSGGTQMTIVPEQLAPAGSVTLTVDAATRTYTLTTAAGPYQFPTGKMVLPESSDLGYTRSYPITSATTPEFFSPAAMQARGDLLTQTVAASAAANGALRTITTYAKLYNVGQIDGFPRFLSAAQWGQFYQENASGVPGPASYKETQGTRGLLVFGQRTAPGDIPVSGNAHYALNSLTILSFLDGRGTPVTTSLNTGLDVDFSSRKLGGTYDLAGTNDLYKHDAAGNLIIDANGYGIVAGQVTTAVHASGSTVVNSDGSFSLALAGNGSVHTDRLDLTPVPDIAKSLTGSLTGAFFGAQAAEVGGMAVLPVLGEDGSIFMQTDAFAGIRKTP